MGESKSKILIIGVTGNLGFELAVASLNASHPTFGLVRDSAFLDPNKIQKLQFLTDSGIKIIKACSESADPLSNYCYLPSLLRFLVISVRARCTTMKNV